MCRVPPTRHAGSGQRIQPRSRSSQGSCDAVEASGVRQCGEGWRPADRYADRSAGRASGALIERAADPPAVQPTPRHRGAGRGPARTVMSKHSLSLAGASRIVSARRRAERGSSRLRRASSHTNRRKRSSRIVMPVFWLRRGDTQMIDLGMAGAVTLSCSATFRPLPATK